MLDEHNSVEEPKKEPLLDWLKRNFKKNAKRWILGGIFGAIFFILVMIAPFRQLVGFWFSQPVIWIWPGPLFMYVWSGMTVANYIHLFGHDSDWRPSIRFSLAWVYALMNFYISIALVFILIAGSIDLGRFLWLAFLFMLFLVLAVAALFLYYIRDSGESEEAPRQTVIGHL